MWVRISGTIRTTAISWASGVSRIIGIDTLTYTNSLEELKEQGLEIQLTHHHETHKKTLENGNEIAKEYDYLKDIYPKLTP
ncbi:hypothetical protein VN0019_15720 [Helicobacter pylori]